MIYDFGDGCIAAYLWMEGLDTICLIVLGTPIYVTYFDLRQLLLEPIFLPNVYESLLKKCILLYLNIASVMIYPE